MYDAKRSLIFNYITKDSNDIISSSFSKYNNQGPIQIIDNLLKTYEAIQIEELIIEDHDLGIMQEELRLKIQEFQHLESLGFNRCKLGSLRNLPIIHKLQRFTVDGNNLRVRHMFHIHENYPELISLSLIKNDLQLNQLKDFVDFISKTQIVQLNIFSNPIAVKEAYTELFAKCPNLQLIDNLNRQGEQVFYEFDDDTLHLELGRNEGDDLKNVQKLLKDGKDDLFIWTTDPKRRTQFDIDRKEQEIERSSLFKKMGRESKQNFKNEMQDDDDEDDDEFQPNQIFDEDQIRNTNSSIMDEEDDDADEDYQEDDD